MKNILAVIIVCVCCVLTGYAQYGGDILYTSDEAVMRSRNQGYKDVVSATCVWPVVGLFEQPGRNARRLGSVYFGETVVRTGDEAVVKSEGRSYFKVQSQDGQLGWVQEYLFIEQGGPVVLLRDAEVFLKPGSATTTTGEKFLSGELLIFEDYDAENGWVKVVGMERYREGWVRGIEIVSVDENDIQISKLLMEARLQTNNSERKRQLEEIRDQPGFNASNLAGIVNEELKREYPNRPVVYDPEPAPGEVFYDEPSSSGSGTVTPPAAEGPVAGIVMEKVIDMETGNYYNRITETAIVLEVKGPKKPKNMYWCYHKTRPIGSKVLLHIPEGGAVQLEVVSRLRQSRTEGIGLGKKLLESVYGSRYQEWAEFSYPQ